MTKLQARYKQVSLKPMHEVSVRTVTFTFDQVIQFSFATHHFVLIIICAELFSNLTMHDKDIGQIQTSFTEAYALSLRADCHFDQ